MSHASVRPPRLAERLLGSVLGGGEWSESILGDLHEEHAVRAARSRPRAAVWYWTHAVRLATRGLTARGREASPASSFIAAPVPPPHPGDSLMRTLGLEMRHAGRSILKRPALSAIVVITLGLGLGANAAVFSMIDALVLRPFTMPDVDRITLLSFTRPDDIDRREALSPADFLDLKRQQPEYVPAARGLRVVDGEPGRQGRAGERAGLLRVGGLLSGPRCATGDGAELPDDEETQGRHRRVVIGHGLWQRRFASDPAIVGRAIEIDAAQYEVVGIAPPGFDFPMGAQIWAPLSFSAEAAANRRSHLPDGHRPPDARAHARRGAGADGGDRRAARARSSRHQHAGAKLRVYTLGDGMMDIGLGPILSMW